MPQAHQGDFLGIPATRQRVAMTGTTWHRFRKGRICEGRRGHDRAGLLEQLGYSRSSP
ncbi:ester cyclase [Streptomyces sp. NPDC020490]|uniref:ester cyclase n=1 Tax=Streptomyces sp. NPDC020490 TaxID=3365078 RepID=UPI003799925B